MIWPGRHGQNTNVYWGTCSNWPPPAVWPTFDQITTEDIDALRSFRKIAAATWVKHQEILRQFFGFCLKRKWIEDNPAAAVDRPKNIKPNEVEPYTRDQVIRILMACDDFGRGPYERLRARAMVLLLRYTALRISDVALLEKARVRAGEITVRTMKSGKTVSLPVHPNSKRPLMYYQNRGAARAGSTFSGPATARRIR